MMRLGTLALVVGLWLSACSSMDPQAGRPGGDETGNGLAAIVVDRQGKPCAGALVRVRPSWYLRQGRDSSDLAHGIVDLRSDGQGHVRIDGLPTGSYRVEVSDSLQGILATAEVDSSITDLGTLVQAPLGTLTGTVALSGKTPAHLQLWGVERDGWTDSLGNFSLSGLPSGTLRLRAGAKGDDSLLGEAVVALPAGFVATAALSSLPSDPQTWDHAALVDVRTTSAGAGVSEDLLNVPVLVRLNASNFPFDQASRDGSDLAARTLSGAPLALEISWWDPTSSQGCAWVRLDTLRANSVGTFRLVWGAGTAPHRGVYDTASGWSGVWHLARTYWDAAGRLRTPDATAWGQDAFLSGAGLGSAVTGPGVLFSQSGDAMTAGAKGQQFGRRSFTWESWVRVGQGNVILMERSNGDTTWDHGESRILLGDARYGLHGTGSGLTPCFLTWGNHYAAASWAFPSGTWAHLAVRRTMVGTDSGAVRWFLNGVPDTATSSAYLAEFDNASDSLRWRSGASGGAVALDEMRISRVARSDAWIKFAYESQKPGSTVVSVRGVR